MPKGYWIGRVDVHNEAGYKPYAEANPAIFKKFGGQFRRARRHNSKIPEGASRSRNVVIEFPDYAVRGRVLQFAGISGQYENAAAARRVGYHHH